MHKINISLRIRVVGLFLVVLIIYFGAILFFRDYLRKKYDQAIELYSSGNYEAAQEIFDRLGDYKESGLYLRKILRYIDYNAAIEDYRAGEYETAVRDFSELGDFEDSEEWLKKSQYAYALDLFNAGDYENAYPIFSGLGEYNDSLYYAAKSVLPAVDEMKKRVYEKAQNYYDHQLYDQALEELKVLEGDEDSAELIQMCEDMIAAYNRAMEYYNQKEYAEAIILFEKLGDYADSRKRYEECEEQIRIRKQATTISAGLHYSVALKESGEIKCTYDAYDFSDWNDIISVAGFGTMIIGLKEDGTALVQGRKDMDDHNPEGLQDVRQAPKVDRLQNVVQVVAGQQHVAALKADGTVVADGLTSLGQTDTEEWKDIVSIAAGWMQTVGVDSSGHVWFTGRDQTGQAEAVKFWDDIVAVSTGGGVDGYPGNGHTVGLKRDGTVVAAGENRYGQCDVAGEDWTDIIAISAGDWHTVGLRKDGTVVSTRPSKEIAEEEGIYTAACDTDGWTDVVAISAGCGITLGLKRDGSIISSGYGDHDQRPQAGDTEWMNIRIYKEWEP